jgi:hypothetical protein
MNIATVKTEAGDFSEVQVEANEFVWLNDGRGKLIGIYFAEDHLSITSYGPSPVSFSCPEGTKLDIETIGGRP